MSLRVCVSVFVGTWVRVCECVYVRVCECMRGCASVCVYLGAFV